MNLVARVTGYPPEMLEPEMELDSDLGLDTARQQAVQRELAVEFNLAENRLQINGDTTLPRSTDPGDRGRYSGDGWPNDCWET